MKLRTKLLASITLSIALAAGITETNTPNNQVNSIAQAAKKRTSQAPITVKFVDVDVDGNVYSAPNRNNTTMTAVAGTLRIYDTVTDSDGTTWYRIDNNTSEPEWIIGTGLNVITGTTDDANWDNWGDNDGIIDFGPTIKSDKKYKNKLVRSAAKLVGYFHYGSHAGFGNWKKPSKKGTTDCSGFVWLAMKRAGYPVGSYPFTTADMERDAKGAHRYLKKISPSKARPGDVIIANVGNGLYNNGHTAVIDGTYNEYDTQIIQMGGDDHTGPAHRSFIGRSFGDRLLSGRVTYARPVHRRK
ncbi:cell wall-associated NlpC family hydrolase [Lactobacillus colini]|uniref:Cell wall-associated NlpC family hydrolase n=1 Tax=Lactobacillus colini TaxID=1819254 RepID=A0ABS4MGE7_9LACO|nr:CHAP domain-containing protein [Lactobacillus colini]MBP2058770.1 cell wall-associated NlpC family hydrolase [Lactobacillus colini]